MHLDYAIAQRAARTADFFFVQIGAFDGRTGDPLYDSIMRYQLRGLLVEPQERHFRRLQETYAGQDNLEFRQVAIAPEPGLRELYTVADEPGTPEWAQQLASFDKATLLSHRPWFPQIDRFLRTEVVETVTLNSLLAETRVAHIDLLQLDAEGCDGTILRELDFERFAPSIIHFEHSHLTRVQHDECVALLISNGYQLCLEERDTLAYQRSRCVTA